MAIGQAFDFAQSGSKGEANAYSNSDASLELVLRPPSGNGPLDIKIMAVQKYLRAVPAGSPRLEKLGWLFVANARSSFDDNFYLQAENCALLLDHAKPGSPPGLLLKGHVLVSTHRFAEAEAVAKSLVAARELGGIPCRQRHDSRQTES